MGVLADIRRTYRRGPASVVRGHLASPAQESRAGAFLLIGCFLVFVAQWPRLARAAHETGDAFLLLAAYELLAWLVIWPLMFYLFAWLAHVASRGLGGRGTAAGARLAMFWSWLAAAPLAMLHGLFGGLAGAGGLTDAFGLVWLGAFVLFWILAQREAARGPDLHAT
jgi:hypothetical protein